MKTSLSTLFLMLLLFTAPMAGAQTMEKPINKLDVFSVGLGFGFDYGGLGGNIAFYPQRNIGLFAGLGTNLVGFGYNIGAKVRFVKKEHTSRSTFSGIAMYGYNLAYTMENKEHNKVFYGPTVGVSWDYKFKIHHKNYLSLAFFVPIRSGEAMDYKKDMERLGYTFSGLGVIPFGISVGYRFGI